MFGAMTSLTGGGGLSNSSSASAANEQSSSDVFNAGGVNFGTNQKLDKNVMYAGIAALTLVAVVWMAKSGKSKPK